MNICASSWKALWPNPQPCSSTTCRLGQSDKKDSGSATAALHRAWIDTKVSLGAGDTAILQSVEAGEDRAKEAYEKAVTADLPENIAQIVRRQAASVQRAHDQVKSLRDAAKAAA